MTNKSRILNPYVLLCTIGMLTLFSCKEECLIDCNENAYCKDMECHCDDPEMFKFGGSDTETTVSSISCDYRASTENTRSYRTLTEDSNCTCVPDFIASFSGCTGGGSGPIVVGNCNFLAIYKDKNTEDIYRRGAGPASGNFPLGDVGQDDYEVFFSFLTDQKYACPELDYAIELIDFNGTASEDKDTLFLTMKVFAAESGEIEDSCNFRMVLIPERN